MPFGGLAFDIAGDVAVVDPSDRGSLCDGEEGLPQFIATLLEQGFSKVLLDLHRIEYIDSLALGGIVHAHRSVTRRGGKLRIVNVARRVRELFEQTRLASAFDIVGSRDVALRLFEATVSSETEA